MAKETERYDLIYSFCGISPRDLVEHYPDQKFTLETAEKFLQEHEDEIFNVIKSVMARMVIILADDKLVETAIDQFPIMSRTAH